MTNAARNPVTRKGEQSVRSMDGTELVYEVHGNGPPLVFVTGAGCFRSFRPVAKDARTLAREFTVFSYDRRGRGDSGNTLPYAIEREVEDIEAIINIAGGKACLYGQSSGAVLALEAAMRLGSKVGKVVLYDAPYVHDETEKAEYLELARAIRHFLNRGENAAAMKHFLKGIGLPGIFIFLLRLTPDWNKMVALAPTLAYDIGMTSDFPPLARVSAVATPMLFVVGEKSPPGMHEVARQLASAGAHAEFVQLPGQDHMVKATVLLPLLKQFLKSRE